MAILVNAHRVKKAFSARPLFDDLTLAIETGDRIGLIGPNGAGKSTLLRILAGKMSPDEGTVSSQKGVRVGLLEQVPSFTAGETVGECLLKKWPDPSDWEGEARVAELASLMGLHELLDRPVEKLSGGQKKRVALARELMIQPDLLLLDEPTNHLDVESILWLEDFLESSRFATVTITHDRAFLQAVANRIIEIDRRHPGGMISVSGGYAQYVDIRAQRLEAQERSEDRLKNTLRRETEWLRRGAKARTTKQQARIKRAEDLAVDVKELAERNRTASLRIEILEAERAPKKLIEAKGISKGWNGRQVVPVTDLLVTPQSRIGLLGANGSGKSTLLKILVGELESDQGSVKRSDHLQVAHFEQNRDSLDLGETVMRTVCPTGDHVIFQGRSIHAKSYLDRFRFPHAQAEMRVEKLSGGEQSRLLLAKLFLRPANCLVLDEPTNDLDLETLDLLSELLQEFSGAVIVVSHDRFFLDQVCQRIFAFGKTDRGDTEIVPFAGIDQWEIWQAERTWALAKKGSSKNSGAPVLTEAAPAPAPKKKLSYKEQRELDGMEAAIQKAEAHLEVLQGQSVLPEIVANAAKLLPIMNELASVQAEVERLYARWAELT